MNYQATTWTERPHSHPYDRISRVETGKRSVLKTKYNPIHLQDELKADEKINI